MINAMKKVKSNSAKTDICAIPCFDQAKVNKVKKSLSKESKRLPELADFYKLLGNATRLKILLGLAQGELCVCDIAHVLGLSMAATSHQLKLLRDQGWLSMRNDGKMVYYQLNNAELLKALKGDLKILETRLA